MLTIRNLLKLSNVAVASIVTKLRSVVLKSFIKFVKKFEHVYSILPDGWDICYLGHHLWPKYRNNEVYDTIALPILEKWDTIKSLKYSIGGTGGYLISKKGAVLLLNFIERTGMTNGIDTVQQKSADTLSVYYCKPHLIYSECYFPPGNATNGYIKNEKEMIKKMVVF